MSGIINELKTHFHTGGTLIKLIFINIGVFLIINIVDVIFVLFKLPPYTHCGGTVSFISYWLAVPAGFMNLLLKPWTIFTYMFTHEDVMHIFFNMMVLFFSGRVFLLFLDEKKLLSTYILGGITGALFFIVAYNIFPAFVENADCSLCIGASASVLAILAAVATYAPNYSVNLMFIGPVKLKWIALFLFVLDIISIKTENPGGHIAHIGGALFGYFYSSQLKTGKDISKIFSSVVEKINRLFKRKSKIKVVHRKSVSDLEFNAQKKIKQEKIDKILDKISKSGYESLSADEKDFLFRTSNEK